MKYLIIASIIAASASLVAAYPQGSTVGKMCKPASGCLGQCRVNTGPDACPGGTFESNEGAQWSCGESAACCVFAPPQTNDTPEVGDGHINQAGINLLKVYEGCELSIYPDQRGTPTIGIGRNCATGQHVCPETITEQQAEEYLREDLVRFEAKMCELPNSDKLNQNQFSALVSYAFNIGEYGAYNDMSPYLTNLDFAGIGSNLENMNPIDNRRAAERELFNTPTGVTSGCGSSGSSGAYTDPDSSWQ